MAPRRRNVKPYMRRRRRRIALVAVLFISATVLVFGSAYIARLSWWTVHDIVVHGADATSPSKMKFVAEKNLSGSYAWVIPKRNALFYPKSAIRQDLLETFPRIGGIDVSLDGFSKLDITIRERQAYGMWCNDKMSTATSTDQEHEDCFYLDGRGYIYARAATFSDEVYLTFYGGRFDHVGGGEKKEDSIVDETHASSTSSVASSTDPIGTTFIANEFSDLRVFLERLEHLGLRPRSVYADLPQDFRIELDNGSYVIINLKNDLESTFGNLRLLLETRELELQDGDGDFRFSSIDLRFGNRVFYEPLENEDSEDDSPQ
ncbi:MAG: hypothetical protein WEC58_02335 [Candidatus Paceibacterota bacterium]